MPRLSPLLGEPQSSQPRKWVKKRRSQRVVLSVPVLVYRRPKDGPRFFEGTHTLVVSAHGAMIGLAANVAPDQRLVLQHSLSGEEQECRVVFADEKRTGSTRVAVEFQQAAPNFWRIAFPPADWAPTR
jgi:PilZ domain